jgi:hypothetical protein
MKHLALLSAISLLFWFGIEPARARDCDHHGHYYHDDCWRYEHSYTQGMCRQSPYVPAPGEGVDVRTMEGRIGEIIYLPGPTAESGMVEIRLLNGSQMTLVRLAPVGYLKQGGMVLREGETVSVKGFPVSPMEGSVVVATEIHQGDRTLNLRDRRGRSAW